MSDTLFSIIIPSKDRQIYLQNCVESILSISYKKFEIVITDNSKDDSFAEVVKRFNDERIKYFYYPEWLSVAENFHRGFLAASGKFVTMIGDDDSLSNRTVEVVEWMNNNNVEVLLPNFAVYYWPDMTFKYHGKNFSGQLIIPPYKGSIATLDTSKEIQKCLVHGATQLGNLPQVYYGIVAKKYLDKVYEITGSYVPGASPDMAVASSLSTVINSFVQTDLPLFIAGNSAKSGAGMGAQKKHVGKIEDMPWLPKNTAKNWSPMVPKFWSGPTIWAESFIKASEGMQKGELLKGLNYPYLFAKCYVFHLDYKQKIDEALRTYMTVAEVNGITIRIKVSGYFIGIWLFRLFNFASNKVFKVFKIKSAKRIEGIENVKDATRKLDEILTLSVTELLKRK